MSYLAVVIVLVSISINCYYTSAQTCTCPTNPTTDDDLSTLKSVFILMRHGIRAPWTSYPLDPHGNDTTRYPNGGSQLTDAGIDQAYNVGKFLKQRYGQFTKNGQKRAQLRSSAAQRCIDTISIVAKKLWPQDEDNKKSWQPMIFSLPKQVDSVLYEEPDCEHAEEAEKANLKTQEVQDYENEPKIQELYKFTAEKSGLQPNMYSVTKVFDVIRCAKLNGLSNPDWATPEKYDEMGDVLSKRLNFFYKTQKTQRLRAGPILSDFKTNMDTVINSKPEDKPKNLFLYGSHDFKIASVLSALGDPQPKYPPFAAALMFELHRVGDKNIVRALYLDQTVNWPYTAIKLNLTKCRGFTDNNNNNNNNSDNSPKSVVKEFAKDLKKDISSKLSKLPTISIPNIPSINVPKIDLFTKTAEDKECTFENFVNSVADLTPVDWKTECGLDCKYDAFRSAEENLGKT